MKKSEVLTDTPVKERITAEINAASAKKALVLEMKKVREAKRLKNEKLVFLNKSCNESDDSDIGEPVYNDSSDSSMNIEDEPPASSFQFDTEKRQGWRLHSGWAEEQKRESRSLYCHYQRRSN